MCWSRALWPGVRSRVGTISLRTVQTGSTHPSSACLGFWSSLAHLGTPRRGQEGPGMGGNIEAFPVLLPHRRDGGASCVGPARSHRTCHTEVKPARALLPTAPPHSHGPASKPHSSLFWEPTRRWGWGGRAGSPSWDGEWDRGVGPQGSRTWRVDRAGWQLSWCPRWHPRSHAELPRQHAGLPG